MSGLRGVRFAPSPTGRFHLGNLRTAWASERLARALGEPWAVRFEDIDRPRVVVGAQDWQLADMRALGLVPDEIVVQSSRHGRHLALFERALRAGAVYACDCSRKTLQADLASMASAPHAEAPSYSGRCRRKADAAERGKTAFGRDNGAGAGSEHVGWRFRSLDPSGRDDFLIGRSFSDDQVESFQPSYHWACALDDYDGRYRLLVRAQDLASAARSQRALQAWFASEDGDDPALRTPALFHTSLIVQGDGHRLEKRTKGVTLQELQAAGWTIEALTSAFAKSFEPPASALTIGAADVGGELQATLTVAELLPSGR